jgi:chromosome segregation ATPase
MGALTGLAGIAGGWVRARSQNRKDDASAQATVGDAWRQYSDVVSARLDKAEEKLALCTEDLATARNGLSDAKAQIQRLEAEEADLHRRLRAMTAERDDLKRRIGNLERAVGVCEDDDNGGPPGRAGTRPPRGH